MRRTLLTEDVPARRTLLAALLHAHAFAGRARSALSIRRFLGPRIKTNDILTLAGANADAVTVNGDTLTLTDAGHQEARSHPSSRYLEA